MTKTHTEDQNFNGIDFRKEPLPAREFDYCIFTNCILSELDLSGISFSECKFHGCDLSMAKLKNTSLKDVQFIQCKLLGLRFDECNAFLLSLAFDTCVLNFSSFYKLKLKNIAFKNCQLQEVDFVESDLTHSTFSLCNLDRAVFENSILDSADFRTAHNFSIDPEKNRMAKAMFSLAGIPGLLDKYNIKIE
ncbi:MAG: pentapeptide repeat-containing protein [Bacteroidota bacterium]